MKNRWILVNPPERSVEEFARSVGTSEFLARLLLNRGIDDSQTAKAFLDPRLGDLTPPFLLKGMASAVKRILLAMDRHERVAIWGDYDVDGVTSTTLLLSFFREIGFPVSYFIPDRFKHGYGLSSEPLNDLADRGITLVITVDCGINGSRQIADIAQRHVDVIVVDHHEPPAVLPDATAVVNPLQDQCEFPYKKLAAVGLTFYLLVALRSELRDRHFFRSGITQPDLRKYLDLVAIGTVADVVPLTGVNRILTYHGLRQVSASDRPGVRALCQVSGIGPNVTAGTVGFQLGPRINAAGRLSSATKGVELLMSEQLEEALAMAQEVDAENRRRRSIEHAMLIQAEAQAEEIGGSRNKSLVLADTSWHCGVTGIVASKIVEKYYRPTVIVAIDGGTGKGSGRSVAGFHLVKGLERCASVLRNFGGHAHAAGLTLQHEDLPTFREMFEKGAQETLVEEDLIPKIHIDAEMGLDAVTLEMVAEVDRLAPFGNGNPRPAFLTRKVRVVDTRVVGTEHLQMTVEHGGVTRRCIAFRMADRRPEPGSHIDLAYHAEANEWRDTVSVQLRLRDFRLA